MSRDRVLRGLVAGGYFLAVLGFFAYGGYVLAVSHHTLVCVAQVQQQKYVGDKAVRDAAVARDRALRVLVDVRGQPDSPESRAAQAAYDRADEVVQDAREDNPQPDPRKLCNR